MQTLTQTLTFCRSPLLSLALLLQTSCEHDPRKPAAWGCRRSPAESSEINSATSLPQKWPMSCSTEPSQPIRNNLQAFLATTRIQTVLYFLFIYLFYSHSAGYFFLSLSLILFSSSVSICQKHSFLLFFFYWQCWTERKKKRKEAEQMMFPARLTVNLLRLLREFQSKQFDSSRGRWNNRWAKREKEIK